MACNDLCPRVAGCAGVPERGLGGVAILAGRRGDTMGAYPPHRARGVRRRLRVVCPHVAHRGYDAKLLIAGLFHRFVDLFGWVGASANDNRWFCLWNSGSRKLRVSDAPLERVPPYNLTYAWLGPGPEPNTRLQNVLVLLMQALAARMPVRAHAKVLLSERCPRCGISIRIAAVGHAYGAGGNPGFFVGPVENVRSGTTSF